MNIKERKIELRKEAEARRAALTAEEHRSKSALISRKVMERLGELLRPEAERELGHRPTLFTYMPVKTEVDVTPVMETCWKRGIRVVVPRVFPANKQMKLYEIRSYEDLEQGSWGIREPRMSLPQVTELRQVDVTLVPGLSFDLRMGRLGYGGGFYDRFMQQYVRSRLPKPYIIAAAFEQQIIREVPMGLFDFRIDELITESRVITPNRQLPSKF
ncbi:5-formyltetrahydrofolate cyclo-ligase [Paenibacillus sp. GD4]|jgi:5-formyltetrahydrofolate cyclo-ligase|uniref:5-formyltetrahydrofolate cyclo-ligase n=1 Tax=Paenibacillus TaxID=44249 RepID=UPI002542EA74|nr:MULTISPECIES: 5-formyltetrahydrofolate cyclo-ligase [Paenibacillus]MDQ1911615.1 5-formyltetrahydrofolate cyclo-ligase [Paenibacillus sp. GD4]